jgi:polyisoprenoid-binding protein YceI
MNTIQTTGLRPGRWNEVASLTSARFTVRELGLVRVGGTVPALDAWVDVDPTGIPAAVHAVLDLTGIDTGHAKRDADLQKPHLLDTAKHPHLTFAGRPEWTGDAWKVDGRLTARTGTEVTLRAEITGTGAGGELTVRAATTVDRRALGIRAPRFLIGRYVDVTVEATFAPPL